MEHDTSAEKDELYRIQVQQFVMQAEQAIDAQRKLYIQEASEEIRRNEDASGTLVNYFESRLQIHFLES